MIQNDIERLDFQTWRHAIDNNLTGTINCLQAQIAHLVSGGSIVNVSSIWGQHGVPRGADHSAAAAGVHALTRCAAKEFASRGIRVNAVAV